jgi:hypothetical protein
LLWKKLKIAARCAAFVDERQIQRRLLVELLIDADARQGARQGRFQVGILHADARLHRRQLPRLRHGGKRRKRHQQRPAN